MKHLAIFLMAGLLLAQAPPPQKPMLACGMQGDVEILCGTRSPEDLEQTPDGKYLILGEFVNARNAPPTGRLMLFDMAKKTYDKIPVTAEPLKDWGDPACPGAPGDTLTPHGISLAKRARGKWELYVVNHAGRESIEMYELAKAGSGWKLVWHGCVVSKQAFNDVAALSDGSFIATHPTALQTPQTNLFSGEPSGYVSRWTAAAGESELPGTREGYPNGVLATADGKYMYFNAWTAKEVHKYDLKQMQDVGKVKLNFMPDNITWTKRGQLLAAGVIDARGQCADRGLACQQAFAVAVINPSNMQARDVFDSGNRPLINGVSVALQVGNSVYVGAFSGERLVKFNWRE
ncbi:MAG TPA: SMP-30/gluconolactonase/LRE family protein [Bryobacteraceae bacterium]|nr:SMP-30/gluconolactonase/LRE family protein [Bryobacteraceae bacterium]